MFLRVYSRVSLRISDSQCCSRKLAPVCYCHLLIPSQLKPVSVIHLSSCLWNPLNSSLYMHNLSKQNSPVPLQLIMHDCSCLLGSFWHCLVTFSLGHWLCCLCVCAWLTLRVHGCVSSASTCASPSTNPSDSAPAPGSHPLEKHDRAPVFGNGCAGSDKQFKEESALM